MGLLSSSYLEGQYSAKSQKEKFKTKAELYEAAELFPDVDPYLDLDYAAAMGGATTQVGADSLVPVHNSSSTADNPGQPSLIHAQSHVTSYSELPQNNGYNHAASSLSHSVSFPIPAADWFVSGKQFLGLHDELGLLHPQIKSLCSENSKANSISD